jgi:hypothetical protein
MTSKDRIKASQEVEGVAGAPTGGAAKGFSAETASTEMVSEGAPAPVEIDLTLYADELYAIVMEFIRAADLADGAGLTKRVTNMLDEIAVTARGLKKRMGKRE